MTHPGSTVDDKRPTQVVDDSRDDHRRTTISALADSPRHANNRLLLVRWINRSESLNVCAESVRQAVLQYFDKMIMEKWKKRLTFSEFVIWSSDICRVRDFCISVQPLMESRYYVPGQVTYFVWIRSTGHFVICGSLLLFRFIATGSSPPSDTLPWLWALASGRNRFAYIVVSGRYRHTYFIYIIFVSPSSNSFVFLAMVLVETDRTDQGEMLLAI